MISAWHQLPFDAVFSDETGGNIKSPRQDFQDSGKFPIVDQGKLLIAGYTDDMSRLCHSTLPVIVFGDHTKILKYVDFPFCLGADGTKILRPRIEADTKYLWHYLRQVGIPDAGYDRHFKYLKRIIVHLPSLTEQRRIAAILDQAEETQQKRLSSINLLNTLVQATFGQMFEQPTSNRRGWTDVTLADVVRADDRINYGVVQPGEEREVGTPLVRVSNVVDDDFSFGNLKKIDPSIDALYKRSRLRGDEVLVACVGSIGAIALATPKLAGANIARAVARVRIDESKADRVFISELLRRERTQRYFRNETRTVAQPTLNIKQLTETPVFLPPLALQREFSKRIAKVNRLRGTLSSHRAALDTLFASLVYRAFRGELTVDAAKRELTKAVS